eukprot:scaffold25663_cov77-Cyclotella_meneghiniana.AAC.1
MATRPLQLNHDPADLGQPRAHHWDRNTALENILAEPHAQTTETENRRCVRIQTNLDWRQRLEAMIDLLAPSQTKR